MIPIIKVKKMTGDMSGIVICRNLCQRPGAVDLSRFIVHIRDTLQVRPDR